jgi:hypothetical protein
VCDFGARRKHYNCNKCDAIFQKQGQLKKHKKHNHKATETEMGEVIEYVQTGQVS